MITAEQIVNANKNIQSTDIKGKSYAEVSERIKAFRQICPNGSIQTEILSLENGVVTMKTTVSDEEGKILATGMAQEKENSSFINKTSFIENCETSSVGRALGMCGLGVDMSIASALEVTNAINNQNEKPKKSEKKQDKAAPTEEELNKQMVDSVDKRLLPSGEIITQEQLELLYKEMARTKINAKTILSFAKVDAFEKIPQATFIGIMSKMEKTPDAQ